MSPKTHEPGTSNDPAALSASEFDRRLEELAREHAASLMVISVSILHDRAVAKTAVIATLADLFLRADDTTHPPSPDQLHTHGVRICRDLVDSSHPGREMPEPANELDRRIWRLLDAFDIKERLLCSLHYVLGWPAARSAHLLNVGESAVRAQLAIFKQSFDALVKDLPQSEVEALVSQLPDPARRTAVLAADSIKRRYALPDWSAEDISALVDQARQPTSAHRPGIDRLLPNRGILLGGASLLLAGVCLTAGLLFALNTFLAPQTPTPEPTPFGAPTPAEPPPQARPLSWISSSGSISRRLKDSAGFWNTLWIDVQIVDNGPPDFIGASRVYRAQAWISQPGQSIQLFGLLSRVPSSAYILSEGRNYYLNPFSNRSYSKTAFPSPEALVENDTLRYMAFPSVSPWILQPGTFRVEDAGTMLARDMLVVDWYDQYGQRQSRLWLDSQTGLILRLQEFGGEAYTVLLRESTVTEIAYNQSFPPTRLASEVRDVGTSDPNLVLTSPQNILPTPTLANLTSKLPPEVNRPLPVNPAPTGFNPSNSRLIIQYPNNLEATNIQTGTAQVPVKLFADGYWIGDTHFGLPWMLRCDRSPDGYRLAFNTGSDGTAISDDSLRWFDLREPGVIYEPIPTLQTEAFAYSIDGSQIALFAEGTTTAENGIYLLDIGTGESHRLIPLYQADSLVWSPDGESLALLGIAKAGGETRALLVHVRTALISFQAPWVAEDGPIPTTWPMANWGIPFPQAAGGLEECSAPPGH